MFCLDSVQDASKETLRFGIWSSVYIKLGAPSVLDCFNIIFQLKTDTQLCASVVDTPANVL